MILVDTSVWIDFFRGGDSWETARLTIALDSNEDLGICGPVLMEIRQGIATDKGIKAVQRRLATLNYLPTLRTTYCHAADIYRLARTKGKTIRNTIDCLIAACAIEHRAGLLHRDRDFVTIARLANLELVLPE